LKNPEHQIEVQIVLNFRHMVCVIMSDISTRINCTGVS